MRAVAGYDGAPTVGRGGSSDHLAQRLRFKRARAFENTVWGLMTSEWTDEQPDLGPLLREIDRRHPSNQRLRFMVEAAAEALRLIEKDERERSARSPAGDVLREAFRRVHAQTRGSEKS